MSVPSLFSETSRPSSDSEPSHASYDICLLTSEEGPNRLPLNLQDLDTEGLVPCMLLGDPTSFFNKSEDDYKIKIVEKYFKDNISKILHVYMLLSICT